MALSRREGSHAGEAQVTIAFAAGVALIGIAGAVGHSAIGERAIFGPLYTGTPGGILRSRATRAIIRVVYHLPSVVWAVLGIAVLVAHVEGGNRLLSIVAAIIFAVSGIGNLAALRRPHFGGLLMLAAAALTIADLMIGGAGR